MHISVVVPVHNGADQIGACVEALSCQAIGRDTYEVIVVDDGSTDDTAQMVRRYPVRLLSQSRQGAAAARNRGLSAAQGEVVLFTDADCEPTPNWIEQMCAPFEDPQVSGVKGVYRTRQKSLVARFVQLEYEDKYNRMARDHYIDFVDTYSAGYRRNVLRKVDGFDTSFLIDEDQELSFRLAKAGHKLVFQPSAIVYHQHASTVAAYARKKFHIGYWKVLVHIKHPDKLLRDSHTPQVLKVQVGLMPVLIATLFLSIGGMLPWGAFGVALAVFGLTALPFCVRVAVRDRAVGIVSPFLLLMRAGALAAGLAVGVISRAWVTEVCHVVDRIQLL